MNPTKTGMKAAIVANTIAEINEAGRLHRAGAISHERYQLVRGAKRQIIASFVRGTSAPAMHALAAAEDGGNIDRLHRYYQRKAQALDDAIQYGHGLKRALRRSELLIGDAEVMA